VSLSARTDSIAAASGPRYQRVVSSVAPFDLERMVPDLLSSDSTERSMLELHLRRYAFAAQFVRGKRVLDLACGAGYGSVMLKEAGATHVVGVDLSPECMSYARERYARPGIEFLQADGMTFTPAGGCDVVVSLETIEHVPDARGFVTHLASLLEPGGILVGSVPTTLSTDVNPFHLHDFGPGQFRELFRSLGFETLAELPQDQTFSPWALLAFGSRSSRRHQLRQGLMRYYLEHPQLLAKRLLTTLRHGFCNKYLAIAGRKTALATSRG
jgi:2-polyprenyl-3-methyl-5-hydroxy-6-metoxy-1,4-benzoquinol methylase